MGRLACLTYADEAVLGLEALGVLHRVVDEAEARGLAAAEGRLEAEQDRRLRLGALVHLRGGVGMDGWMDG